MYCRSIENTNRFSQGGLYACFADQKFLGYYLDEDPIITQWHGDLMAMLYYAIDAAHKIIRP
jgi:hypothetical protein